MKPTRYITLLLCMAVLAGWGQAAWEPTNQIFTYQGRLYDSGVPLDGMVDLIVWMRDGADPNTAGYVAVSHIDDQPVSAGYLTLHLNLEQDDNLDLPELFDGSDRWLEFWIRPGESEPNDPYEELYPLIQLEATPFAHAAYRLQTPAALRSETAEPTLTLRNEVGQEVYFEDDTGQIEYSFDALTTIVNDFQLDVGKTFSTVVQEDQTETIWRDKTVSVGRNATTLISLDSQITIARHSTTIINGNSSITTGGNKTESVGADSTTTAGGTILMDAGDTLVLSSTNPMQLQEGVSVTHDPNDVLKIGGAMTLQPMPQTPPPASGYGTVFVNASNGRLCYMDTSGTVYDLTAITDERVSFAVKRSAPYTWPASSAFETIDFSAGTSVWDNTGDGFSTKDGTFVAPADGVYSFHGVIFFTGLAKGDLIAAAINAAGRRYRGAAKSADGADESVRSDLTVYLQTGDLVALEGSVSAASPPTVFGAASSTEAFTHFNGARVD